MGGVAKDQKKGKKPRWKPGIEKTQFLSKKKESRKRKRVFSGTTEGRPIKQITFADKTKPEKVWEKTKTKFGKGQTRGSNHEMEKDGIKSCVSKRWAPI